MNKLALKGIVFGIASAIALTLMARQIGASGLSRSVQKQEAQIPQFQFDPTWPKPLPNKWALGSVVGTAVDSKDHIWIVHRTRTLTKGYEDQAMYDPPEADCCIPAPAVIEFDQQGNVVQAWGGPGPDGGWPKSELTGKPPNPKLLPAAPTGTEWPEAEHTVLVDYRGNVWVANSGGSHILKFTHDGKFLLQVGRSTGKRTGEGRGPAIDSNNTERLGRPAGIDVDQQSNEVYIADGYGNRRVIVFDADTGAYKRHWGAYGNKPDDAASKTYDPHAPLSQQFNLPHCVRISIDNLLYVCDRANNRIQIFKKDGTFVKEAVITPQALRGGVMDIAFSPDREQRFLYVADGRDEKVWILRRGDLHILGSFGQQGHFAGSFTVAHNIAVDSKGNLYITETNEGKRIQRFKYVGMGKSPAQ